jgi:hypothetical protein
MFTDALKQGFGIGGRFFGFSSTTLTTLPFHSI